MDVRGTYSEEMAKKALQQKKADELHALWREYCRQLAEQPGRTIAHSALLIMRKFIFVAFVFAAGWIVGKFL